MSRIYFHSLNREAEVRGSERAYFSVLFGDLFSSIFNAPVRLGDFDDRRRAVLAKALGKDHYVNASLKWTDENHATLNPSDKYYEDRLKTLFSVGNANLFGQIDTFGLLLNTANVMGNDAIKLAARIHGQCEVYCWVKGENRNWLAGIIETGLSSGIYRQQQGWEDVQALLKEDDSTSVVLSYSVCDSFPNSAIAGFVPTKDENGDDSWDAWHDLDFSVQWQQACEGLERSGGGLELSPDNWSTFYFAHGWDSTA